MRNKSPLCADTLARLRACRSAGLSLPEDLISDIEDCLANAIDAATQRSKRDLLIRRAAVLSGEVGPYAQATALADEAKSMRRIWRNIGRTAPPIEPSSVRGYLHAAQLAAALPESVRQFYRVLQRR